MVVGLVATVSICWVMCWVMEFLLSWKAICQWPLWNTMPSRSRVRQSVFTMQIIDS